jgi:hypothetical protein
MKNVLAGLTALVFSCLVATSAHATFASGPDVCAYRVTNVFGVLCPLRNGQTACLSQSAKIGNCDTRLECFGGPGFFCKATLIPKSGPEKTCPFGSVRPRGFTCFQPIVFGTRTPTPTAPPVGTDTATFTPTDTPLADTPTATPTGTAAATATDTPPQPTATDTPPQATATDTPPGPTATATDTPVVAPATSTATQTTTPSSTVTVTATGTPTGTAEATATATVTATGTATGTAAASLVLRF